MSRNVTFPLVQEDLQAFFEDKSTIFNIVYKDSKIKGKMFLVYLSNLELNIEIDLDGANDEEIVELVKEYFSISHIVKSQTLIDISMQVLFEVKDCIIKLDDPLTPIQLQSFMELHDEIIQRWVHFVDSSLLYIQKSFTGLDDFIDLKNDFNVIDDITYVGQNVVNLFSQGNFMTNYFSSTSTLNLDYFERQFDEYMFKGSNLFTYFNSDKNELLYLFEGLMSNQISYSELIESIEPEDE